MADRLLGTVVDRLPPAGCMGWDELKVLFCAIVAAGTGVGLLLCKDATVGTGFSGPLTEGAA